MNSIYNNNKQGFTLIELLVVISIISLLSSIVLASLSNARQRAYTARVNQEFSQLQRAFAYASSERGRVAQDITSNGCTRCNAACLNTDLRNVPVTNSCYIGWVNVLTAMQNAGGNAIGLSSFARDPWGSPYLFDENDGYFPGCVQGDNIWSVGPDGRYATADDIARTFPLSGQKTNACP